MLKNKKRKYFQTTASRRPLFLFSEEKHAQQKNNWSLGPVILHGGAAGYRTPVRTVIIHPSTNIVRLDTYVAINAQNAAQG